LGAVPLEPKSAPIELGVWLQAAGIDPKQLAQDLTNDQALADKLKDYGVTAPRITPQDIEDNIDTIWYWQVPDNLAVVCALRMKNGAFTFGHSVPVSAANFVLEVGQQVALKKAKDQMWELLGFQLKSKLYEQSLK
jgi:hypothetical protein